MPNCGCSGSGNPKRSRLSGTLLYTPPKQSLRTRNNPVAALAGYGQAGTTSSAFATALTYDTQGMNPGMRTLAKFLPPLSVKQTDQYWLTATRETQVATASAFGMIAVRDAKNTQQRVEAGRLWQRMHLLATVQSIAMHPLSQPVERRDRELQLGQWPAYAKALSELQQDESWQAVMPFRMGYPAQDAPRSP